jgi:hypothetical protein
MRRLKLLTNAILKTFADMVYNNQRRVHRVWIVSPWIGGDGLRRDPLYLLIEAVRRTSCDVILITRPPKDVWHQDAINLLEKYAGATVYYCPALHTKLYLLECNGFRGAVLGSPNLTSRAEKANREIAVEFRTTVTADDDDVATVINELTEYVSSLRGEDGVYLKQSSN